jgi:hypothetical protein
MEPHPEGEWRHGLTVNTGLLVEIPPGYTRHKVCRIIGSISRRVAVDQSELCRDIQVTDMFPPPAINMGG